MLAFTFILLLSLASAVFGANDTLCANIPTAEEVESIESAFSSQVAEMGINNETASTMKATIPVHFHVIRIGNAISQGNVPNARITQQISILNQGFEKSGVRFRLASVDRRTNPNWYDLAATNSPDQTQMKNQLRLGGKNALNIYSVGNAAGRLGYATYPWAGPAKDDGVVIGWRTMPGGTQPNYNQGKTLTHSVGHWAGLYHTFQGGCTGGGDFVDDTPAALPPTAGQLVCVPRNTCPGPGGDPIHNFMDYTYDSCRNQFTLGQVIRMTLMLWVYRGIWSS